MQARAFGRRPVRIPFVNTCPATTTCLQLSPDTCRRRRYIALRTVGSEGGKLRIQVTVVHVEANHTAHGDLTLDRGAAVMGLVSFDDGAPAGKVLVTIEKAGTKPDEDPEFDVGSAAMMMAGATVAAASFDDRGLPVTAGIASGDYTIKTRRGQLPSPLRGGVDDVGDAQYLAAGVFLIRPAPCTERRDKITSPLARSTATSTSSYREPQRRVSGQRENRFRLVDHHGLNEDRPTLTDASGQEITPGSHQSRCNGSVHHQLCSRTYTLIVAGRRVDAPEPQRRSPLAWSTSGLNQYAEVVHMPACQRTVDATDVTGINVELEELESPTKRTLMKNDLIKMEETGMTIST